MKKIWWREQVAIKYIQGLLRIRMDVISDDKQVFAYTRSGNSKTFLIVLNMSEKNASFKPGNFYADYELIVSNYSNKKYETKTANILLQPWEALMYEKS